VDVQRLAHQSLRDQARAVIRSEIVAGDIAAGRIYSAVDLAERLGVSATRVREALLDLASAGLVTPVRNRGFRVLETSDEDLDEIVELRLMLEVGALRRVVKRARDAELAALRRTVDDIGAAANRHDLAAFLSSDLDFHLGLLRLGGNRRLVEVVAPLRDQTRLSGIKVFAAAGALGGAADEHRAILDAVMARDVAGAEDLMRRHIGHTRGVWSGRPEDAPTRAG
jgi:DNA-binding GntR family transcriptional regulator